MLFTCIAVLSCLVVKGDTHVKYESLGYTSCWVGQDKYRRYNMEGGWQEAQSNSKTSQDRRIREVLQEIAVQVCTSIINVIYIKRKKDGML
jgi:L,D-peptidoglycan transpeptidase YkuD (ErfK/YbiS/YcfS/YnhG family)